MEKEILDFKGEGVAKANRVHIGIFGDTNSGKSTLLNLLSGQSVSLVSGVRGTTTDPVYKPMEIQGVGASTLIDTAGFEDDSELGAQRMKRTSKVLDECDIYIYVERGEKNKRLLGALAARKKPLIKVFNGSQLGDASANTRIPEGYIAFDKDAVLDAIREAAKDVSGDRPLLEGLLSGGESVLLVMPQDIQAPKGRLILPQVQTMRALLDLGCSITSCKTEDMKRTLDLLKELVKGAAAIDSLNENSKVLISEACTHAPLEEDIGRVKIPALLRKKYGNMSIDFSRGLDFPEELDYDLIIMCGSCMFNRAHVLSRIEKARAAGVPVTNYGVTISKLKGIIDKVEL